MRGAFQASVLAAELKLARCAFLKRFSSAGLVGAMRVACTQSLRGSGSLCDELNAPLYLNEIIELPKKA